MESPKIFRGFKEADFVKTMDFVDEAVEIAKAVQVFKSQFHPSSILWKVIFLAFPKHYPLNPLTQAKSKKLADFKAVLAEDSGVVAQCADLKSR